MCVCVCVSVYIYIYIYIYLIVLWHLSTAVSVGPRSLIQMRTLEEMYLNTSRYQSIRIRCVRRIPPCFAAVMSCLWPSGQIQSVRARHWHRVLCSAFGYADSNARRFNPRRDEFAASGVFILEAAPRRSSNGRSGAWLHCSGVWSQLSRDIELVYWIWQFSRIARIHADTY